MSNPTQQKSKLEQEMKEFEEWLKTEEIPEHTNLKNNKKIPSDISRVRFLLSKNLIIELAKKGYSRTRVWKYLKRVGKIDYVFLTFCRHVRKHGLQKYFSEEFREQEIQSPLSQEKTPQEKPEVSSPQRELKSKEIPQSSTYNPNAEDIPKKYFNNPSYKNEGTPFTNIVQKL
ncbi:hypothetical protein FAI40_08060 [Acetobacteraceae bacterium]|nr:hypothetical protein FAI40_08060 [Acetobacteraceae bacterium]